MTDFGAQYGTQRGELKQNSERSVVSQERDNPPLQDQHQRTRNVLKRPDRDISG